MFTQQGELSIQRECKHFCFQTYVCYCWANTTHTHTHCKLNKGHTCKVCTCASLPASLCLWQRSSSYVPGQYLQFHLWWPNDNGSNLQWLQERSDELEENTKNEGTRKEMRKGGKIILSTSSFYRKTWHNLPDRLLLLFPDSWPIHSDFGTPWSGFSLFVK